MESCVLALSELNNHAILLMLAHLLLLSGILLSSFYFMYLTFKHRSGPIHFT